MGNNEAGDAAGDAEGESATESGFGAERQSHQRKRSSDGVSNLPTLPNRFQVRHELGRGGAGKVYRAYDRSLGHEVALKMLHGVSVEDRLQLKNEFRALSDIVHANLVNLYELVIDERWCFFTMELVLGRDFATYVRGLLNASIEGRERHERLYDVARQLASALNALHQGGKLHRDVKPWNVLVTEAGRVVLVDFGLAVPATPDQFAEMDAVAGTPMYMSPEQLVGAPLSAASDWYSFGVTLYEAVSGHPPARLDLSATKQPFARKGLRARGCDVPEDFDDLVHALLARDASVRPPSTEILARLGSRAASDSVVSLLPPRETPDLVNREQEMARLHAAFERADGVAAPVVRVLGPSGIGKTAILRAFSESIRSPKNILLRSRCHPQETVVFNALDGLIDGLANEVAECLDPHERALPPAEHAALTQVFPVLAHVLQPEALSDVVYADDRQKRQLAFIGLREILRRIATRYRIVAWLDDVQWGDQDSGALLRDLIRQRDVPSMLFILSYRTEDESSSPCLRILREDADIWSRSVAIEVGPLDESDSARLAGKLLGSEWHGDRTRRDRLIDAAAGSPYLIGEIARYLSRPKPAESAPDSSRKGGLKDILDFRTRELPAEYRPVLEVLAVAGAPQEQQITLAAAGVDAHARGLISSLERLQILRTTDVKTQRVEFYHDKLREQVMSQLTPETRARHHLAIGRALVTTSVPDPLAAIDHFEAAADVESVRRYIVAAASLAVKNLAFDRAARLYQRAIELKPSEVELHELHRRLGSVLGSLGRGKQAAAAYSSAARLLRGESVDHAEQIAQLEQKAAEQLIQTGHFRDGIRILRSVLSEVGVAVPKTRQHALRKAALLRLGSLVHGYRSQPGRAPATERELQRFDALWAASSRLSIVDYALSSWATARCATDSVQLQEPSRMSRAITLEASFCCLVPLQAFQKRVATLLQMAEELASKSQTPEYDATFIMGSRSVMHFYNGRFREAWHYADLAMEGLRACAPGRTWEHGHWPVWALFGLTLNGELRELIRRMRGLREYAILYEDRFVDQNISVGAPTIAWVATDSVDEAEARADQVISWAPSEYTAQHYMHYVSTVDYALYRDDAFSAWRKTVETWPSHSREGFLVLNFIRDDLLRARGRSALAAAIALGRTGRRSTPSGHRADQLLRVAKDAAKQMRRHRGAHATGFASLLEGGIAKFEGRDSEAARHLETALLAFESGEMWLFHTVARYCRGRLRTGSGADPDMSAAEQWLISQGVVKPLRLIATLAPGLI
jgi:serine/threonine protein kinase/tetratricopeptide (TPR) repeat protein